MVLRVEDAEGNPLALTCGPEPACPCWNVVMEPDFTMTKSLEFRGEQCVPGSRLQPIAPGEYSFVASFGYAEGHWRDPGPSRQLEESYDFSWSRP